MVVLQLVYVHIYTHQIHCSRNLAQSCCNLANWFADICLLCVCCHATYTKPICGPEYTRAHAEVSSFCFFRGLGDAAWIFMQTLKARFGTSFGISILFSFAWLHWRLASSSLGDDLRHQMAPGMRLAHGFTSMMLPQPH